MYAEHLKSQYQSHAILQFLADSDGSTGEEVGHRLWIACSWKGKKIVFLQEPLGVFILAQ